MDSSQIVLLGESIVMGDLKVTPIRVEQREIKYHYDNRSWDVATSPKPALVLTLECENLSKDVSFAPNDLSFNRKWKANDRNLYPESRKPYTFLEMGKVRFYGGPCDWNKDVWSGKEPRVFVVGQRHRDLMRPGEKMEILVTTDPDDPEVLETLEQFPENGRLLWRVQLRRGLVRINNYEVSATCFIGVRFTKDQIVK
jgi:hypothetical protein